MTREEYLAIVDTISGLRQEGEGESSTLDLVVEALASVIENHYEDFNRVQFLTDTSYEGAE
jgi:hypothetical protein